MKYGITKPHLFYYYGYWFCTQQNKVSGIAVCPSLALKNFLSRQYMDIIEIKN